MPKYSAIAIITRGILATFASALAMGDMITNATSKNTGVDTTSPAAVKAQECDGARECVQDGFDIAWIPPESASN